MPRDFRLDGADELYRTLGELTKPTQRNVLMRTLREDNAFGFLQAAVKANAPYEFGDLRQNLFMGTRLTRRQRSMPVFDRKATAEVHFGTADPAGFLNEFGLANNPLQPFFRPEWEGRKQSILASLGRTLGEQIVNAGVRAAKKKARSGR